MLKTGVIGYGYWGPNIVRGFSASEGSAVKAVCDSNPQALKKVKLLYPQVEVCSNPSDLIDRKDVDVVAIVTPVSTHFALAKAALENGKHIFVEKPFTASIEEAEILIALAQKKNLIIMVDHTFIFTGAVRKIKELVDNGTLGDIYYYDSTRVNLGLFQSDVNVVWDLAPHDFSIIDYVIKNKPLTVTAQGVDHFNRGHENIAYITVYFENNMLAHLNLNWLSPVKIRATLIGGQKKMLVWNDLEADEKIKIYDRGVSVDDKEGIYKRLIDYRSGDMWAPLIDRTEALKVELEYFIDCISHNKKPINDGESGLRVVKLLTAAHKSLKEKGTPVSV
ncbi:MAG: Gfo/Idh/MocA family oxidoreductase [Candidatus Omnitrophica bacterium]|nr:Gfo/Idh/MocA family oxidoreductase [Candidatus Omnitrophota bacterium]